MFPLGLLLDAVVMGIERTIASRLHNLRTSRRMTLDRLAVLTGFSKGYLSKIENAKKVPPIASLAKICKALATDIAYFFQTDGREPFEGQVAVVRVSERKRVTRGGSAFGYNYESLAHPKRQKRMEPFIFTFPPRLARRAWFDHEEEEFVFVLKGRVEFEVEAEKWVLEEGDCLYLGSKLRHKGRSLGGEAKALVVISNAE
jgi:transcriptional regulator with XRE-family HTH domain